MNEHDTPILAPNTFHLESLLANLREPDQTVNRLEHQWTEEFLSTLTKPIVTNVQPEQISFNYW